MLAKILDLFFSTFFAYFANIITDVKESKRDPERGEIILLITEIF